MPAYRPIQPRAIFINGKPAAGGLRTKNMTGTVPASAIIDDTNNDQNVRLLVRWSTDPKFTKYSQAYSGWVSAKDAGRRVTVNMTRLARKTLYYVRLYTQDSGGLYSATYTLTSFYTNMPPPAPVLVSPPDNTTFQPGQTVPFDWTVTDPEEAVPRGTRVRWRTIGTPLLPAGPWEVRTFPNNPATAFSAGGAYFKASTTYEWQVAVYDPEGLWSEWSLMRTFSVLGNTRPPLPVSPGGDVGVVVDTPMLFRWTFQDPAVGATQGNADVRYRAVGSDDSAWVTIAGAGLTDQFLEVPENTLLPGVHYEWQVRTYRSTGLTPQSDWSASSRFWSIITPGSLATDPLPLGESVQGALGCGNNRVFIYEQGGAIPRGEITNTDLVKWSRRRDDISTAEVKVSGWDEEGGELLGSLRTWRYELVIRRDGERVWEGPITRLTYSRDSVEIEARDVLAYAYRRILRQGYNDGYHVVGGVQLGLNTVVERAYRVLINAFSYADPNVLPYLTPFQDGQDAKQSRIVPDFTKTVWEEIDDMASHAGLDYTVVGRRIMFWDTHNHPGVLAEMNDEDFSESPIVSEYGMLAANFFGVTDGNGAYGSAYPPGLTEDDFAQYYGPLEQLASAYGDLPSGADEVKTPAQMAQVTEALSSQAARNVNGRWPAPLIARVPDNASISPEANVGINQLVPGVWIPLRVNHAVRQFRQMQKLDSVTVIQDSAGERVEVVMSPAPLGYEDPDQQTVVEEA